MGRPTLHLTVALLVVLAGCSALEPDPPRDDRAVAALEDARSTATSVETYRYGGDLEVVATGEDGSERVTVRVAGAVNTSAQRLNSTAERDGRTRAAYLVNRTLYRECPRPRGSWEVEEVSIDGDWAGQTPIGRQLSLLDSGALHHEGGATVRGRDTTVLAGEPTERALRQYQEEGSTPLLGGPRIRDPTVRLWIDNETDRLLRTSVAFEVTEGGNTATARMTMRYVEYGEPVSIEVPPDAHEHQWETGCPGT